MTDWTDIPTAASARLEIKLRADGFGAECQALTGLNGDSSKRGVGVSIGDRRMSWVCHGAETLDGLESRLYPSMVEFINGA